MPIKVMFTMSCAYTLLQNKDTVDDLSNGMVNSGPPHPMGVVDGIPTSQSTSGITAITSPHRSLTSSTEGGVGVGAEYSSSLDKLNSSLTELQGEIMKLSLKRGSNNGKHLLFN